MSAQDEFREAVRSHVRAVVVTQIAHLFDADGLRCLRQDPALLDPVVDVLVETMERMRLDRDAEIERAVRAAIAGSLDPAVERWSRAADALIATAAELREAAGRHGLAELVDAADDARAVAVGQAICLRGVRSKDRGGR